MKFPQNAEEEDMDRTCAKYEVLSQRMNQLNADLQSFLKHPIIGKSIILPTKYPRLICKSFLRQLFQLLVFRFTYENKLIKSIII